jgi:ketose-bisphosphate aldolase
MYVNTKEMLLRARNEHFIVIGAECWSLNSANTLIDTATELNMPLIIMLWEGAPEPMASQELICDFVRHAAGKSPVPIAMHLDHAHDMATIYRAIHAGFSSVMLDASELPFSDNVKSVQEAVRAAHACGVTVEAELGHVGGAAGAEADGSDNALTIPEEAAEYVRQTGIDSLAVSIGTVHGLYKSKPHLDMERLKRIYQAVDLPLVLHGGSGTGFELLKETCQHGISKLNVMTDLMNAASKAISADSMCAAISECLKGYMLSLSKAL